MKLHDNSRFGGRFVIFTPSANLLKSQGLVELSGYRIGLPNLQINSHLKVRNQGTDQIASHTSPAESGSHGEVEHLAFSFGNCTGNEESGDAALEDRDLEIVMEIIGDVPLG